jgi:hypothetical protein
MPCLTVRRNNKTQSLGTVTKKKGETMKKHESYKNRGVRETNKLKKAKKKMKALKHNGRKYKLDGYKVVRDA